jgi:hypothetical protein
MPGKEWQFSLGERFRMLVFLNTRDGKVLSFAVVLVGEIEGKDVCVTRYDTAHGLAHRDVLGLRSGLIEKEWLFHLTTDQAFNYAYQDIRKHYETYIEYFQAH